MPESSIGRKYGLKASLPDPRRHRFGLVGSPHKLPDRVVLDAVDTRVRDQGGLGAATACGASSAVDIMNAKLAERDQGQLGCCVGEGTSGGTHLDLLNADYKWPFTPSVLDIYYRCREKEGTVDQDAGAMISDAFDVLRNQGVCPEDSNPAWSWPFSSTDQRWKDAPPDACKQDALQHKIVKYAQIHQDPDSIKAALASGFPVVIGCLVYPSFESAPEGVIPMPSVLEKLQGPLGGHCTFLWGYGNLDANHADGRNSWTTSWGDRGNYHIPFGYLCDPNLTSDLWLCGVLT